LKKSKLTFKHGLIIYTVVLLAIMGLLLLGLRNILVEYEESQAYNLVEEFCNNLEKDLAFNSLANEEKYLDSSKFSRFEDAAEIREQYLKFFSGKSVEYSLSSDSHDANNPVYIIHHGTEVFGELTLHLVSEKTKLSMLSIAEWEITSFVPEISSLGSAYAVTVPEEYSVTVNGSKLGEDDIASQKNGEILYLASGLTKDPTIVITNSKGEEVSYETKHTEADGKVYYVEADYTLYSFTVPANFTVSSEQKLRKSTEGQLSTYSIVVDNMPTVAELEAMVEVKDFMGDLMHFTDSDGIPAPAYYAYELSCPDIFTVYLGNNQLDISNGSKTEITEKQYSNAKTLVTNTIYTANSILADAGDAGSEGKLKITDANNNTIAYKAENGVISTLVKDVIISVPDNFSIAINGQKPDVTAVEGEIKEYEELKAYTTVPKSLTYTLSKQYAPVQVTITNNLQETETVYAFGSLEKLEQAGRPVIYEAGYPESYKKIADAVDPINYAKQWSLYMTTDLEGETKGYYTIRKYIVNNSYLDKTAKAWATGYESALIGKHIFDNPPFHDVWYKNVVVLNENAFYCDVHFIKSFTVTSNNTHRDDIFYHRIYFVYVDDDADGVYEWQILAMKEIIE